MNNFKNKEVQQEQLSRVFAYEILEDLEEMLLSRVGSCLDLKHDSAELAMEVVQDTVSDFKADIARVKTVVNDFGTFSLESDILDIMERKRMIHEKSGSDGDFVDEKTLSITLSSILERLEQMEDAIKKINGKSH